MTKKNRRDIPWTKITAEGVAIVVSILLAFGIEAWWSDRQEVQLVEENLAALRDELTSNLEEIRHERTFRQAVINATRQLFELAQSEDAIPAIELDRLLSDVTWGGRIDVSTGALLSTLQTGILTSIDESELRRSLSSLPALYEITRMHEQNSSAFTDEHVVIYINTHGSLLQVFNSGEGAGRPGGRSEMASPYRYPVRSPVDHSALLGQEAFLGYLAMGKSTHENIVLYYDRLEVATQHSIELIEQRID
ncbi:MAG: hypothetical protein AAF662_05965 [Pseudomonadota bacterium]